MDLQPRHYIGFGAVLIAGFVASIVWISGSSDAPPPSKPTEGSAYVPAAPTNQSRRVMSDPMVPTGKPVVPIRTADTESAWKPESPDAGVDMAGSMTRRTWDDPVNQKVLGDPQWMAQPDKQMQDRIKTAFKTASPPPDPRIQPLERRLAIEALRPVVDRCYEQAVERQPGLIGRAIVIFDASATESGGVIKNVRMGPVVKLDETPGFSQCVVSAAEGMRFDSTEPGDARTVEYPFFYDGN